MRTHSKQRLFVYWLIVLALLCVMYFITYIDRVNVSTAASDIQSELGLSNAQLGFVFSAFAYPYLAFQVVGGWVGDKFGPETVAHIHGMTSHKLVRQNKVLQSVA